MDETAISFDPNLEFEDKLWDEHLGEAKKEKTGDVKPDKENAEFSSRNPPTTTAIGEDAKHHEEKPTTDARLETIPATTCSDFTQVAALESQDTRESKRRKIDSLGGYHSPASQSSKRPFRVPATPKRSIQLFVPPSQSPDGQPIFFKSPSESPSSRVMDRRVLYSSKGQTRGHDDRPLCQKLNSPSSQRQNANLIPEFVDATQHPIHALRSQRSEQSFFPKEPQQIPDTFYFGDEPGDHSQTKGSPVIPSVTEDLGTQDDLVSLISHSPVHDTFGINHSLSNRPKVVSSDQNHPAMVIPDSEDEEDELELGRTEARREKEAELNSDIFCDSKSKASDDRNSEEEEGGEEDRKLSPEVRTNVSIPSNTQQSSHLQNFDPQISPLRTKSSTRTSKRDPSGVTPSKEDSAFSSSNSEFRADSMENDQSREAPLNVDSERRKTSSKPQSSSCSSGQGSTEAPLPAQYTPTDTDQQFIETQSPTQPSKNVTPQSRSEVNEADISTEYIPPSSQQVSNRDRTNVNAKEAPKSSPPMLTPIQEEPHNRDETNKSPTAAARSAEGSSPEPLTVSQLLTESLMETIPPPPLWMSQDEGTGT